MGCQCLVKAVTGYGIAMGRKRCVGDEVKASGQSALHGIGALAIAMEHVPAPELGMDLTYVAEGFCCYLGWRGRHVDHVSQHTIRDRIIEAGIFDAGVRQ